MTADQLQAALNYHDDNDSALRLSDMVTFVAAARRWLDLQPEECGTCDGDGHYVVQSTRGPLETDDLTCPTCHGSGYLYLAEIIRRINRALDRQPREKAVAVLDALCEADPT